jgi:glycosyltransferase involved in cell wall biosynthesis
VLLVPSSDYLGHPFPQRQNQIFELLNDNVTFEIHVARFCLYEHPNLSTNVIIHELKGKKIGSLASYYLINALRHSSQIRQIVRREGIDAVVLSNLAAPLAYSLIDELSSLNVPVVFDLPDFFPTSAAGYVFDLNSVPGKVVTGIFDSVLRYLLKRSNLVTVPSFSLAEYARSIGAKKVAYVPNGISNSFLKKHDGKDVRKYLGFESDDIVVGYVGSVEFWLDLRSLIKGLAIAREKGLKTKLLIVGKKLQSKYSKRVEDWIRENDFQNYTRWLDFVPHYEVPKYMAALDIGTIPFDISNPTAYYAAPNKLWEYFSQKRIVISTLIPEVIRYSKMVFFASTPTEYAEKLSIIFQKKSEVQRRVIVGYKEATSRTWVKSSNILASRIYSLLK